MSMRRVSVQSGRLTTEGDELYYEVRGQGQPLLMIPAAGGDGDFPRPPRLVYGSARRIRRHLAKCFAQSRSMKGLS
jgi:hypothetical protein